MVKLGIIGCGIMGKGHAQSILDGKVPGAEWTAVCDTDPAVLQWAGKNHPSVKTFEKTDDLLNSGAVDAVIIATPHYDHPVIAMQALDKKIHVLVEKPAGVYTKAVREMNAKAAASNVVFAIMYNQRTHPIYRKMREMVQGGQLGELKRTSWLITDWYRSQAYYNGGADAGTAKKSWRATWKGEGGGVLINQCPHNLDLWQWICGMPKKITAFAHAGKWHDIEVEDDVTAYVEYENGATGVFITSTADCPGNNRFEVLGDLGKLVCENDELVYHKLSVSEREFNRTNKEMFAAPSAERIVLDCAGEYTQHPGVIAAFVEKINGTGELYARGEEGINGLTISNAMHLSSWLNRTIELPIDEDVFLIELMKRWGGN
ncbi:MAG: Gfo/Idh/MocA family oxidoreductase [Defluviitaleaceae bacterium]|nr:Gfo/Idh/MocA family oxidoreductase [Defluviitaleaceae bacterium]